MTSRIFKSIFATAAILITVVCIGAATALYTSCEQRLKAEQREKCETLLSGYASYGVEYVNMTGADVGCELLLSPTGEILFGELPTDDPEEISAARASGVGYASRMADSHKILYCAVSDDLGNVVCLSLDFGDGMKPFFDTLYFVMLAMLFSVTAAFFLSIALSRSITKPLSELDGERPAAATVYPELKPLADKLNFQSYKISKQIAEERRRTNEFNSITSNMSEGMIVINSNTLILSCNDAAKRILGARGELPRGVLSLRNTPEFRDAVLNALGGKNGYDYIKTEDKFYSILVTPVKNDFEVQGAVIVIIDDTEKEHRESLRREFTSNVSHELKTPLTSISGFAELIRDGIATEDDAKRFAANIHKEAGRLIVLVGDIIRLSMLDGGELACDERVELLSVCSSVVQRLSGIAEKSDITLTVEGEQTFILGNELIIEEMIYNLADNGIKYNKPGGYVKLSVFSDFGDSVVCVRDNGIGIPADKQDRVFERFYRVDKSHSKSIGGTGLGLSIVKHAALRHSAKITLKSEPGEGTEISVRFPKAEV